MSEREVEKDRQTDKETHLPNHYFQSFFILRIFSLLRAFPANKYNVSDTHIRYKLNMLNEFPKITIGLSCSCAYVYLQCLLSERRSCSYPLIRNKSISSWVDSYDFFLHRFGNSTFIRSSGLPYFINHICSITSATVFSTFIVCFIVLFLILSIPDPHPFFSKNPPMLIATSSSVKSSLFRLLKLSTIV